MPIFKTAKQLFCHLGMSDTSLDWNGKDGALSVDLGKPLKNLGLFDFIINGGTAEHVYDQYECWKNIHNLCKEGGLVVSVGPLADNWLKHSPWRYSLEFFDCLCFKNNYDLLERKVVNFKNQCGLDCHYISFRKNKGAFISKDVFVRIWNNHHKEKINE
jgi:SAM-dependent methyltransferase